MTPHDAGHAATGYCWCYQRLAGDEKHVAHGTADDPAVCIQCEAFEHGLVVPFVARQHLFQAVQCLDAGQLRLSREPRVAQSQGDAVAVPGIRQALRVRDTGDQARGRAAGAPIAAWPLPGGQQELRDAPAAVRLRPGERRLQFGAQRRLVRRRQPEPCRPRLQPLDMVIPQARRAVPDRDRFEQPVAVLKRPIVGGDRLAGPSVPEPLGHTESDLSMPSAFARVSASSARGSESATMPAPARRLRTLPCSTMVRIRILRSRLPSRFR